MLLWSLAALAADVSVLVESLPSTLHPLFGQTATDDAIALLVYERLGAAPLTYEMDPRAQTGAFTVDAGATWHDGRPVTPADVCYSLDAWKRWKDADWYARCRVDGAAARVDFRGKPLGFMTFDEVPLLPRRQAMPTPDDAPPPGTGPGRAERLPDGVRLSLGETGVILREAPADLLEWEAAGWIGVPPSARDALGATPGVRLFEYATDDVLIVAIRASFADAELADALAVALGTAWVPAGVKPWSGPRPPAGLGPDVRARPLDEVLAERGFARSPEGWTREGAPLRPTVTGRPAPDLIERLGALGLHAVLVEPSRGAPDADVFLATCRPPGRGTVDALERACALPGTTTWGVGTRVEAEAWRVSSGVTAPVGRVGWRAVLAELGAASATPADGPQTPPSSPR